MKRIEMDRIALRDQELDDLEERKEKWFIRLMSTSAHEDGKVVV